MRMNIKHNHNFTSSLSENNNKVSTLCQIILVTALSDHIKLTSTVVNVFHISVRKCMKEKEKILKREEVKQ